MNYKQETSMNGGNLPFAAANAFTVFFVVLSAGILGARI
jgi:hypothetical protein